MGFGGTLCSPKEPQRVGSALPPAWLSQRDTRVAGKSGFLQEKSTWKSDFLVLFSLQKSQ